MLPHYLCSHIQNAFRARHQHIAVPHSTQNLAILSILLRAGFLSNVTRGTIEAPSPTDFLAVSDSHKRIWADLKYRDDRPVLSEMELISRPSKPIFMDLSEIRRMCTGRRVQNVKPLRMGEIAIVKTKDKEKPVAGGAGGVADEDTWRGDLSGMVDVAHLRDNIFYTTAPYVALVDRPRA